VLFNVLPTEPSRTAARLFISAISVGALCVLPTATFAASASGALPVRGGSLIFTDVAPVPGWQTQRAGAYNTGNVLHQVLDRLTYFEPAQRKLVPWIASAFLQNAAATEFTFTIRPGVTFSDGTALDADAVAANYDLLGRGNPKLQILPSIYLPNYDHAEVIDARTVKIVLSKPNASFLYATSSVQSGLVSKSTLALNGIEANKPPKVIGSGPFVYESDIPDQQIVLRRRADYAWPPISAANRGAAYLEKVTINVLPEEGLRAGALTSNQVQLVRGIQPTDEAPLREAGYKVLPVPAVDLTSNFTSFRPKDPIVDDINVRRALNIAFDREKLVTVLGASFKPAYSVLNPDDPNVIDLKDELKYDPDKARYLLDAAGWKVGAGGVRQKDGQRLQLVIPGNVNQQPAVLLSWAYIQEQWRQIGVEVDIRSGDVIFSTTARTDARVPLMPLRTYEWGGLASLFIGATQASLMFNDPEIVALDAREKSAVDPAERRAVFRDVQRLLVEKAYVIPISNELQVYGSAPDVHVDFDSSTHPNFQGAWTGAK
jgi:peptide/nickel transport system substrate-binding protein